MYVQCAAEGEGREAKHRLPVTPKKYINTPQLLTQVLYYVADNACDLLQAELLIAVSRQREIFLHQLGV